MKRITYFVAAVFLTISPLIAYGGLMSSLASRNGDDDILNDSSLGVIERKSHLNETPQVGDIAWGLLEISAIRPGGVKDNTYPGNVYVVYALTFASIGSEEPVPTVSYSGGGGWLNERLGLTLPDSAVAAVFEVPGTTRDSLADLGFGSETQFEPVARIQQAIDLVKNTGSFLFAFGINATEGDFFTSTYNSLVNNTYAKLTIVAQMSVVAAASGINISDFKELYTYPGFEAAISQAGTQVLQSTEYNGEGYILTNDSGNYIVNYVPEPGSLAALAGLVCGGAGLGFLRRRRKDT